MALPVLTPEQRAQALAKAAEARKKRAEVKGELKSGKRTLADVLKTAGDDGTLGKMKVSTVLESLPGVGKVRAQKIMEDLQKNASVQLDPTFFGTEAAPPVVPPAAPAAPPTAK